MPHTPVLLNEIIKFLEPKSGDFVIDGTIDGGGHATEILKRILPKGKLLGIDLDKESLENARIEISASIKGHNLKVNGNLLLIHGNYADIPKIIEEHDLPKADGLLLDLGFSSNQLEVSGKGFSFNKDEPLMMTYDNRRPTVKELLKELSENELAQIIHNFSGERYARRIAKAIKVQEQQHAIETSREFADVITKAVPRGYERGRIQPATRTFQALRIYANDELANLEKALNTLPNVYVGKNLKEPLF